MARLQELNTDVPQRRPMGLRGWVVGELVGGWGEGVAGGWIGRMGRGRGEAQESARGREVGREGGGQGA